MKILFAVRMGNADWQEELITESEDLIEPASEWARKNGFDRLRVATISDEKPEFGKRSLNRGGGR
jgi:hypothetical protein